MLYSHQQKLIDLNPNKHLLAWETGTGKTIAAIKLCDDQIENTLIICPKSLKQNWENELKRFSQYPYKYRIIHKEEFKKLFKSKKLPEYKRLIIDEAHYFSGIKSGLHKSLCSYIKKYKPTRIYLLTATPYLSTPFNILALGLILGQRWSWWEFKNKFFYEIKMGHRMIPMIKKGIEKDIAKLVLSLGSAIKLEECIDIPEQIFLNEYFELNATQKKLIKEVDEFLPIVRFTKQHRIENEILDSEKTKRVLELANEYKKIAIVCRYLKQLEMYQRIINHERKIFVINGATTNKQSVVNEVNAIEDCIILIQSATCEGYNLWSVPIMVFASHSFSFKDYIQMKGRIQRISHVKKNIYLNLITSGGVDQGVMNALNRKIDFDCEIYRRNK